MIKVNRAKTKKSKSKKSLSAAAILFSAALVTTVLITGCSKSNEKVNTEVSKDLVASSNKGKSLSLILPESKISWEAKKVTGEHVGTVDISGGSLTVDNGKLTGGNFDIDFNSIKVLQLDNPEMNAKLTGHLKSDDFFSVEKFPVGKFEITSLSPQPDASGNNYMIGGTLTIKGITKPVTFPAKVNINGDNVTASADFNIDRTLWDIKFRSGKFYENLGDNLIYDDFNIKLNIAAK